jgi:hypothetical protein
MKDTGDESQSLGFEDPVSSRCEVILRLLSSIVLIYLVTFSERASFGVTGCGNATGESC